MKYKYAFEEDIPLTVEITFGEVDNLIKLLDPIARDDTHEHRWKASTLVKELKGIRLSGLSSALASMNFKHDALTKEEQ